MKKVFPQLWYVLLVLATLLVANFLFRLVYLFYNWNSVADVTTAQIFISFLVGIRFDLATIFIVNGILFFFFTLPLPWLRKAAPYKFSTVLLLLLNLPVLVVNGIDVVYFSFSSKRMTHELFTGRDDLKNFGIHDFLPYWWLVLLLVICGIGLAFVFNRIGRKAQSRIVSVERFSVVNWLGPVFAIGFMFMAIRGGFQGKPLRPANAFVSSNLFLGNLGLNTGYTVLSSIEIGEEALAEYVPNEEAFAVTRAAFKNDFDGDFVSDEFPLVRAASFEGPENKYNVVFLILESFNAGYSGSLTGKDSVQTLTPTLDSLAKAGIIFTNFYANGTRSVESLPAILNSQPDIFKRPLIGSSSETNTHWGIGNMLSKRGYHTSFFCGGENGTVGFDSYSRISGLDHYFGQNEFPGSKDGVLCKWGIHDLPVLNWMADVQEKTAEPFLTAWFSISNHFPFDVPQDCPSHIRERKLKPSEKTAMYTDYAIGRYFKKVSKMPWFSRTIFVITADHCLYGPEDANRSFMESFHVPLIMLGPGVPLGRDSTVASQLSILPTLIELLRLDTYHASAAVSLFSKTNVPIMLSNMVGVLTLAQKNYAYCTTFENSMPCFSLKKNIWTRNQEFEKSDEGNNYLKLLQSVYQVCYNARIKNKTFSVTWMK